VITVSALPWCPLQAARDGEQRARDQRDQGHSGTKVTFLGGGVTERHLHIGRGANERAIEK
jgi:hypothetical protein